MPTPSTVIGQGVTLRGLRSEDFSYTWNISGTNGVAPEIGCAMTQDITADETAKRAGDGDTILGALGSYENRIQEGVVVGAIYHKGNFVFNYTGTAPVRGNGVVGSATLGKVKDAGAKIVNCIVVAVYPTTTQVLVKFD